mmetsp:Transcript_33066/g.55373  ORF Transcript_33066/g.55373 Transcript_33066/m.55373 type:complete len:98 (-) Transcript_33066:531-824(-)
MGQPLLYAVLERPLTSLICACLACVWAYLNAHGVSYSEVGLSYSAVVHNREYWRILTATFSHISILHLVFNVSSLWSLGFVESVDSARGFGEVVYLK